MNWPAAVLWDMDGTLVDTEPYWIEAEYEIAEENGGTWSHEHALQLVGNDLLESGRYIREHMGIEPEPSDIVEQLPDLTQRILDMGADVIVSTPQEFTAQIKTEVARWTRVVKEANIPAN